MVAVRMALTLMVIGQMEIMNEIIEDLISVKSQSHIYLRMKVREMLGEIL